MDHLKIGNRTCTMDEAQTFASRYLRSEAGAWAYPAYDGYMTASAAGPITDADLLAPVLLNVSHLSISTYYRLQDEVPHLQQMLNQFDPELTLLEATDADLQRIGALFEGIDANRLAGARATTLSKILHRKRPALIPLQDRQVRSCYQQGPDAPLPPVAGRTWEAFTTELARQIQSDLTSQLAAFEQLAALAPAELPVTALRVFDIIAWWLGGQSGSNIDADASTLPDADHDRD